MGKETTESATETGSSVGDDLLVQRARAGDITAFGRLVTRYQDRVVNVCWRICGHLDDAQDLAQDVFLKAFERLRDFEGRSSFYTWLFRIAANAAISQRRRRPRMPRLTLHDGDGTWPASAQPVGRHSAEASGNARPEAQAMAAEMHEALMAGLEQLDEDQRAVVVLRDIEGLDYRQIGEVLDLSTGTVKSRLHRARMELRKRLRPMFEAPGEPETERGR